MLCKHWNWREYSILKGIIAESGLQEAKDELEKLMGSYCDMKPISVEELPVIYVSLLICHIRILHCMQQYDEIQTFVFDHLDVQKYNALPYIKFLAPYDLEWCRISQNFDGGKV